MSVILEKDNKYITIKYSIKEYEDMMDYNLYELSDDKVSPDLSSKLDKALKTPKQLLVNI